jgi:hypothetical protein
MQQLRLFLLLLLTITLPVTGLASVLPAQMCPMQTQMHAATAKKPACCVDSARHGTPCKAGQACSSNVMSSMPLNAVHMPSVPASGLIIAARNYPALSAAPASVWRPPRV